MKRFGLLLMLAGFLASCNEDVTPSIPVIKEFAITVVDKADVPVSKAQIDVYMSHKSDFVVTSKTTDIFGKARIINLKPGEYIFKGTVGKTELFTKNISVSENNEENAAVITTANYATPISDFKVTVQSDRGAAISERKVDLVTKEESIVYKSANTDSNGEILFEKVPLGEYLVKVYDEMNEVPVITDEITVVEDITKNVSNVEIIKLIHSSDIVITGFMVDPKGSDSPKVGTTSGSGFQHIGGYEYIQLMALKDINFDETPYCVITGMNATNPDDSSYPAAINGWVQSMGANSKTTYQMNLTSGSVKKGQFFYVGGMSRMIASYYDNWGSYQVEKSRWWEFDFYKPGSNNNGKAKEGSGLLNNLNSDKKTNVPDGIAVFKGTEITKDTEPQDVVFYGGDSPIRKEDRYLITDNDLYRKETSKGVKQPYFGDGTNTWFAHQNFNDDGCFIMMGGTVTPTEWLKPRTGKAIKLNVKNGPDSIDISDIESAEGATVFSDK